MSNPFIKSTRPQGTNLLDNLLQKAPSLKAPSLNNLPAPAAPHRIEESQNMSPNPKETLEGSLVRSSLPSGVHNKIHLQKESNANKKAMMNEYLSLLVKVDQKEALKVETERKGTEFSTLKTIGQINSSNIKLPLLSAKESLLPRVRVLAKIAKVLSPLAKAVVHSSRTIFRALQASKGRFSEIRLTQMETGRLKQGLAFYQSTQQAGMKILELCLSQHPLGKEVLEVSKQLGLDTLRGFYVAKHTYATSGRFQDEDYGFSVPIGSSNNVNLQNFMVQARSFLQLDKINLLNCYRYLISGSKRPSQVNACSRREELSLLWNNQLQMESQSLGVQNRIFDIFVRYGSIDPQSKFFIQLENMKARLLTQKVHPEVKKMIEERNVNQMLAEGSFREGEYSGHFQDLISFLVHCKEIDYCRAIGRLAAVEKVSAKWVSYFETSIASLTLGPSRQLNLLKGVYLYKLFILLTANGLHVSEVCERVIIKEIGGLSVRLGIQFLPRLHSTILKIRYIKVLSKLSQPDFQSANHEESQVYLEHLPELKGESLVGTFLDTVKQLFRQQLHNGDITIFQNAISRGKSLTFNFGKSEVVLETIKFYTNLFSRFPSQQSRIQDDTVEMFAILQGKNISIEESFFLFNKRLFSRLADPLLIAKHLCFAIKIVQASVLPQVLTPWLGYIAEEDSLSRDYGAYGSFFDALVEVATCRRDTLDLIKVVFEGIHIFEGAIKRDLDAEVNNQGFLGLSHLSHLRILVLLTRVLEYCDLTETEIPSDFLSLFVSIKDHFLSKINTPLHILTNSEPGMRMSERLILFHALIIPHTGKSRMGLGESQLGEVVGRQAIVSLCDIYSTVSQRLKAESQIDAVDLLFVMTSLDSLLGAVVIQERGIELAHSISKIDCLTLLQVSRLVQVLTSLQKARGEGRGESQQVPVLVNAMLARVVAWLTSQECTARLFQQILELLLTSMNGLQYSWHMTCLSKGLQGQLLRTVTHQQRKLLPKYGLYLICLLLANPQRLACSNSTSGSEGLQIKTQLSVFTELLIVTFQQKGREDPICESGYAFADKLVQILAACLPRPLLAVFVIQKFTLIRSEIDSKIPPGSHLHDKMESMSKELQIHLGKCEDEKSDEGQAVTSRSCPSAEEFNRAYLSNMALLQQSLPPTQIRTQLARVRSFILNNEKHKIEHICLDAAFALSAIKRPETNRQFLDLLSVILQHRLPSSQLYLAHILELAVVIEPEEWSLVEQFSSIRQRITLITTALKGSLVSPFLLLQKFHTHVTLARDRMQYSLFKWPEPDSQSLCALKNLFLPLDFRMLKIQSQKFSLWNFLQLRQKLLLIRDLLTYERQMSGLRHKRLQKQEVPSAFLIFVDFVRQNEDPLNSPECLNTIRLGSSALAQSSMGRLGPGAPARQLGGEDLRQICLSIGKSLQMLGWELSKEWTETLSHFYYDLKN